MTIKQVIDKIKKSKPNIVVWTGGEPALQADKIYDVIHKLSLSHLSIHHHLETNGDIELDYNRFHYICFSPKDKKAMNKIIDNTTGYVYFKYDVKVVTNLKTIGKNLIRGATMLMPLTTSSEKINEQTKKDVWNYCVKHNIKFCLRQHVEVWGMKKKRI